MTRLVLFHRPYCHLCEEMAGRLHGLRRELGFELELVDIDESPELRARYNVAVPVLAGEGGEICRYHLDEERLRDYLARS